jgi:hypothetical protein
MRLAFEAGADSVLENLIGEREHTAAQLAYALAAERRKGAA